MDSTGATPRSWKASRVEICPTLLTIKAEPRYAGADLALECWGASAKADVLAKAMGREVSSNRQHHADRSARGRVAIRPEEAPALARSSPNGGASGPTKPVHSPRPSCPSDRRRPPASGSHPPVRIPPDAFTPIAVPTTSRITERLRRSRHRWVKAGRSLHKACAASHSQSAGAFDLVRRQHRALENHFDRLAPRSLHHSSQIVLHRAPFPRS